MEKLKHLTTPQILQLSYEEKIRLAEEDITARRLTANQANLELQNGILDIHNSVIPLTDTEEKRAGLTLEQHKWMAGLARRAFTLQLKAIQMCILMDGEAKDSVLKTYAQVCLIADRPDLLAEIPEAEPVGAVLEAETILRIRDTDWPDS